MQIGAMNHPARQPLEEIAWIGSNGFDFVDFMVEPPAADPDRIDAAAVRAHAARTRPGCMSLTGNRLRHEPIAATAGFRRCESGVAEK